MSADVGIANAGALREAFDAFRRADWAVAGELLHEDVVWEEADHGGFTGLSSEYHGPRGVARWMRDILEAWDSLEPKVGSYEPIGEHVLIGVELAARGRGSGLPVESTFWNLLTFADGKVVRRRVFTSREEALAAAE